MRSHPQLRGILTMLCAVSLLAMMDVGLKQLSAHYPPLQLLALRVIVSWPLALVWIVSTTGLRTLVQVRWPLHLLRAAIGIAMMWAFVYGIARMPLTTAYTLFFVAPLTITALSVPLLGENVTASRWIAILTGFGGVLVALRPTGEGLFSFAGIMILLAAFGYAFSAITVRVLARTDSTQAMVFWLLTLMGLGSALFALPGWVPVRSEDWWWIAGIGIVGVAGQYAITEAFRRAEASVIAPLEYTALVWSVAADALLWGLLPDGTTWIGAAIVVASGIYLMRSEGRTPVAAPDPAATP